MKKHLSLLALLFFASSAISMDTDNVPYVHNILPDFTNSGKLPLGTKDRVTLSVTCTHFAKTIVPYLTVELLRSPLAMFDNIDTASCYHYLNTLAWIQRIQQCPAKIILKQTPFWTRHEQLFAYAKQYGLQSIRIFRIDRDDETRIGPKRNPKIVAAMPPLKLSPLLDSNTKLTSLTLCNNVKIDIDDLAAALAKNTHLVHLEFSNTNLSSANMAKIVDAITANKTQSVQKFFIGGNAISGESIKKLTNTKHVNFLFCTFENRDQEVNDLMEQRTKDPVNTWSW